METLTTTTGAVVSLPIVFPAKSKDASFRRLIRFSTSPKSELLQDDAMGLVLSAANVRGWTTGSGIYGRPTCPAPAGSDMGRRTTRAVNPHAYTDGTVFVQVRICHCVMCIIELHLLLRMKCYVNSSFNPNPNNDASFNYFDSEDGKNDDIFPFF
ncbi:hypothetical protein MIMGU_mgv1a023730mg [Erythranthe guttata]|uniref:Uncharacterized protein n=1 Tax=Erythranthe guttata TaxID=4155 RepID=A0A022PN40_ERYGU|nr:hypothetical protein MIMGU_mgv1a023730mg [Erythranthe guttata]